MPSAAQTTAQVWPLKPCRIRYSRDKPKKEKATAVQLNQLQSQTANPQMIAYQVHATIIRPEHTWY
jgi:hypothetical protein